MTEGKAGGGVPGDALDAQVDALIDALFAEMSPDRRGGDPSDTTAGRMIFALDSVSRSALIGRLMGRIVEYDRQLERAQAEHARNSGGRLRWHLAWANSLDAEITLIEVLRFEGQVEDEALLALLDLFGDFALAWYVARPRDEVCAALARRAGEGPFEDDLASGVRLAIKRLRGRASDPENRKLADNLARLNGNDPEPCLDPGEAWSDAALADLGAMDQGRRRAWLALLRGCQWLGLGKPTARWIEEVAPLFDAVGHEDFRAALLRWFPLVDRPRTLPKPIRPGSEEASGDLIEGHHVDLLKGLVRCAWRVADRDIIQALGGLALGSYREVPGKGPRMVALGNAAVAALGSIQGPDALGQLALLRVEVEAPAARKGISKAFAAAASREGTPRDGSEEPAAPSHGEDMKGDDPAIRGPIKP